MIIQFQLTYTELVQTITYSWALTIEKNVSYLG